MPRRTRMCGDEARSHPGEAVRGARGELLPVLTPPGLEPTNNLASRRSVSCDRPADHAGRGARAGNRWCERIWTVVATCVQQGRPVFAYLAAAVGRGSTRPSAIAVTGG